MNKQSDIAIIGMSGRFPGADSVKEFWKNLCLSTSNISRIDRELLLKHGLSSAQIDNPNYVNASGLLNGIENFDAKFFKISPAEAEILDPQVRLLLECGWETLEDAGYATDKAQNIGVFAGSGGMATSYYSHLVNRHSRIEKTLASTSHLGNDKDYLSTYLSYRLNLTGPSISIQTACSTSLVAVHQACLSLLNDECEMALAGGVRIAVPHYQGYEYKEGYIFSRSGQIKTFDASADGVVFGSGLGLVLLKPLLKAEADGDAIYAVIKSTAIMNDGRDKLSYAASSARGQTACARKALQKAGISADDIGFIECHGTGTLMGDPEEVKALASAFRPDTERTGYCALGAVKPNIGHLDAAAGIASLIKTTLVVNEGCIPPTLHYTTPNPRIKFEKSPFFVNPNLMDWEGKEGVRTAGVNGLGVGGTNAFLVLQNYSSSYTSDSQSCRVPVLTMSARSKESLLNYARKFEAFLANEYTTDKSWESLCYSLQVGREAMKYRLAIVADTPAAAIALLSCVVTSPDEAQSGIHASWVESSQKPLADEPKLEMGVEIAADGLERLAASWVCGGSTNWQSLYGVSLPKRMHLPTYAFERQRYWLDIENASQSIEVSTEDIVSSDENSWDGLSYLARWESMNLNQLTFDLKQLSKVLLISTGESSSLCSELRNRLRGSTNYFEELHLSKDSVVASGVCIAPDELDQLATYIKNLEPINTLIFIAGKSPLNKLECIQSSDECELPLLQTIRVLKQEKKLEGQANTYLVSLDQTNSTPETVNTFGGGLAGIAYSLSQGHYAFKVRHIDVDSSCLATAVQVSETCDHILALPASNRGEQCRIANGSVYRQIFSPFHRQYSPATVIRKNGLYIILGGSGVVGGIFTRYLISRYDADVVWVGRSDINNRSVQERIQALGSLQHKVHYYQADAIDAGTIEATVTQIVKDLGNISGAFFASQIIDYDSHIDTLDFKNYEETLATKCHGSWNFFHALANQPLDFLCYFSSGQAYAFSGAAKLCAYASAISASERVIKKIQAKAGFPVGTINWGFWNATVRGLNQSSSVVSTDNLTGLEDLEGYEGCEAFLSSLLQRQVDQLLCIRLPKALAPLFPLDGDYKITGVAHHLQQLDSANKIITHWPIEASQTLREVYSDTSFDQWLIEGLFLVLQPLLNQVPSATTDTVEISKALGINEKYIPWLRETLHCFQQAGFWPASQAGVKLKYTHLTSWVEAGKVFSAHQELSAMALLAMDCIEATPNILRGMQLATDIIFPNASMEKVKNVYANNILSDVYNYYLAEALFTEISSRLTSSPNKQFRVLEIGAGTGGTSSIIFKRLDGLKSAVEVYTYTDLSKAFFFHAESTFKPDYSYIDCQRLDIGKSIESQGFDIGTYDFVVATNCLHATSDIRAAVRNAKSLLKQDGIFLVNELSRLLAFHHVTSGLLDGWWLATDKHLRIPSCPGLSPEQWQRLLVEEGFYGVEFPASEIHDIGQQVIVAKSNGVSVQRLAPVVVEKEKIPSNVNITSRVTSTQVQGDKLGFVVNKVKELLAACLRMSPHEIDTQIAFSELGLDSILAVSFVDSINRELDVSLNTAVIFEFSSAQTLAEHVLQSYSSAVIKHMPVTDRIAESDTQITASQNITSTDSVSIHRNNNSLCEIAIIGMSGQFPKADSCDEFWRNLVDGVDGIEILPDNYLDKKKYSGDEKQPGKTRCKWGGVLRRRDSFDSLFFHISPREAESMNPHQRLVLQESWKTIEDAGYNPKSLSGSQTGVFIGAEPTGYFAETFTGYSDAIVASRIAYYLNLRGPAFVVNTGCSASAVALHLACESLRSGECSLALAGGVNACMNERVHLSLSEIDMLSPSGRCATFDGAGDGTVISEGIGLVLLKPLDQAILDGDAIYGTIIANGINQDGASNGITAPNGAAQEQLIQDVYQRFGVSPDQISYVEAHGTGTKLGDPVEVNALTRAFRSTTAQTGFCALGSSKSHIGHTAAAAGVIGLIKVLLSMQHNFIPRMLHYSVANPLLQLNGSPFYINESGFEWQRSATPRIAALNSFGHSGTNAHMVIKEYIDQDEDLPSQFLQHSSHLILLSAKSKDQLRQVAHELLEWIGTNRPIDASVENVWLAKMAYTLQTGRESMEWRFGCLAANVNELIQALHAYLNERTTSIHFAEHHIKGQSREVLDLLNDEEMTTAIHNWMRNGKYKKLLSVWIQGKSVDWSAMYNHAIVGKLHLPSYPFADHRFWSPIRSSASEHDSDKPVAVIHPMIHENVSDFSAQKYSTKFSGEEFYLTDHRVKSISVLPAVAYLEMAIASYTHASSLAAGATLVIKNVVWAKPIRVKDPVTIEIHLWPLSEGAATFEIVSFKQKPEMKNNDIPFCQGIIEISQQKPVSPMELSLLKASLCNTPLSTEFFYECFDELGMMFGPAHRGVRNIWVGKNEVLSQLILPDAAKNNSGDFLMHPSLLDSALQTTLPLLVDMHHLPAEPSLPYAMDEIIVSGKLQKDLWVWVRQSQPAAHGKLKKYDIDIFNPDGVVTVSIRGFTALSVDTSHASEADTHLDATHLTPGSFDKTYYDALLDQLVKHEVSIEEAVELG